MRTRCKPKVDRLDEVEYDEFKKWQLKKLRKQSETAMSTNGELLTEPEFLALLAARKKKKEDELAKRAASKAAREERAEQRIINANDKRRAEEAKIATEAPIASVLVACGCWTSTNNFIKGSDMKEFIRVNRAHLKNRNGYGSQLKFAAAFSFIEKALEDDPDHEWESV